MKKIFYILLVAISYAVVARVGFLATSFTSHISPIFPAAGIALAAVLILGRPALFGVFIGSILANSTFLFDGTVLSFHAVSGKLLECSIIGIGAMSGAATGALLVRRNCNGQYPLNSGRNVLVLVTVGALGCCMISPTVGVLTLSLKGTIPWGFFGHSWLTWWIGDAVGVILAAPLILAWNHSRPFPKTSTGALWLAFESSLLGGLSLLFCFFVFFKNVPIQFGLLPLLFWATARYGDRGATTVAGAITALATIATSHGYGPFVMDSVNESLLLLQSFIGVIIISSLFLGGVLNERKRAEEALRQSEARHNAILSSMDDIVFEIDFNGCFEGYHAPTHKRLYVLPDYFLGKKLDEVLPEDVCVLLRQAIESINSGNPYQQLEYHLTIDNTIQWEHAVVTPRYNTSHEIVGITAVCRDITERKQAEDALRISEAKYRDIVENAPMGIFRRELEGKYQYVNPGLIRQFECKTEREFLDNYGLISQRWACPERFDELKALLLENRRVYGYEIESRLVDGTTKWFALYSSLDDSDQFINGFSLDITERKRAEERLGIATHAARIGIWDWDVVKNVLIWDDSMYALYGIRKEDFSGAYDAWSRTIHPEDKARTEEVIQAALRGEHEYSPEFRILWPDGSIRHIKADSQTFRNQDGNTLRMVGTNIDITERKRAEEEKARLESQLIQAQKMEAIGTLAGGIAHDFNNILSPIVGYTEMAKHLAADIPKLSGYLTKVGEAASRATDLVRQILTFSRKTEQQMVPLQVSSVVKEALKLLRASIPSSIEIRQEIATQALVLADPTRVHQIVMNLCTNAYQSMEKTGGVLAVSLKETEIPHENHLGGEIRSVRYMVLEVSDTGCGMDKETQAKIFEPYFTTKETGKGTGLGLAVVHRIVKDHQGMINVSSEPGRGTIFRVYLPITEDQMHVAHADQKKAAPTKMHEHILFVDDEEQICSMAKEYLTEYGYVVDVCSNGRDALFVIEQDLQAYDLLITDMTMPGMNGKELTKKVLTLRSDFPVILCTGYSSLIDREDAASTGISAYLEKPVVMEDLIGRIKEVLKKRKAP